MPELPEVETTRRGLAPHCEGAMIRRVTIHRRDLRKPIPAGLEGQLEGRRILAIRRRAKYLLFDIEGGLSLLAHLGMSGTFTLVKEGSYTRRTHDHACFALDNGLLLIFHDPRRFGLILPVETAFSASHALLSKLGPEPLSVDFNPVYLEAALSSRKSPVKVALMDQELVVGVGNIYASESLFLAGVDPRIVSSKAAPHAGKIFDAICIVLNDAIASGGSTLRDYVRSSGDAGYFQHRFRVYDKEGEACIVCSEPISRVVQAKRATYFCVRCQSMNAMREQKKSHNRTSPKRLKNTR